MLFNRGMSLLFPVFAPLLHVPLSSAHRMQYLNGVYIHVYDGPKSFSTVMDLYSHLCNQLLVFTTLNSGSLSAIHMHDLVIVRDMMNQNPITWEPNQMDSVDRDQQEQEVLKKSRTRELRYINQPLTNPEIYGIDPDELQTQEDPRYLDGLILLVKRSISAISNAADVTPMELYDEIRKNHNKIERLFRAMTTDLKERSLEFYKRECYNIVHAIDSGDYTNIERSWLYTEMIWPHINGLDPDIVEEVELRYSGAISPVHQEPKLNTPRGKTPIHPTKWSVARTMTPINLFKILAENAIWEIARSENAQQVDLKMLSANRQHMRAVV
jgi:hypothetical protein